MKLYFSFVNTAFLHIYFLEKGICLQLIYSVRPYVCLSYIK